MIKYDCTVIVNGRPIEFNFGKTHKELITDLPEKEQQEVFGWIKRNIKARKTPNRKHSSYGLKHLLHHDTGLYVTNNQFKDAMLLSGFEPCEEYELNWQFCISEKPLHSPKRK